MHSFILSCESTVDLPHRYVTERNISVLFYAYTVDGCEYPDDMGRDPHALPRFYGFLEEGKVPSTSQLNQFQYEQYFDRLLQQGDVLHIALGSGMTSSVFNAEKTAKLLRLQYPDRKLIVIDSLCSSSGYGLLVEMAADMRDTGCIIEEVEHRVKANRKNIHHQFFSSDLRYLRRSGRMSGPAAMLGTMLSICPLMRLDDRGTILAYDKVRGVKAAVARTVQAMAEHAQGGENYCGKCWIAHSNCPAVAQRLKEALQERFPHISGEIRIWDIGTIIVSHCGPGTAAVFFLGDERTPYLSEA